MSIDVIIRLAIIIMFAVGLYFAFKNRGEPKRECPKCGSKKVEVINRQTENIHVETIFLPGVGGRTHVKTRLDLACQKCGHRWSQTVQT